MSQDREMDAAKSLARKVRTNAHFKWAKNTIVGTAKGVAIAAVANTAADATRGALKKRLRHQSR